MRTRALQTLLQDRLRWMVEDRQPGQRRRLHPHARIPSPTAPTRPLERRLFCIFECHIDLPHPPLGPPDAPHRTFQLRLRWFSMISCRSGSDSRGGDLAGKGKIVPAGVSHVIYLLCCLTPERPGGTFADIVVSIELHPHGLFGHLNACLLAQVCRASFRAPVRALLPNCMRTSLDHAEQLAFPSCGTPSLSARSGAPRNGIHSTGQESVQHVRDGVLTAQDDARTLRHLVSLLGKQKHLLTRSALPIGSPS
jgi:hypothetical protein